LLLVTTLPTMLLAPPRPARRRGLMLVNPWSAGALAAGQREHAELLSLDRDNRRG